MAARRTTPTAWVEADEAGQVISYEEYHPFGTSAYRVGRPDKDLSLKRYRFSGREHDDETGLYYFGARYYAAWLGRWTSTDLAGFVRGFNLYRYCSNNPVMFHDPNGMQDTFSISITEDRFTGRVNLTVEDFKTYLNAHGGGWDDRINAGNSRISYIPNTSLFGNIETGYESAPGGTWSLEAVLPSRAPQPPPRRARPATQTPPIQAPPPQEIAPPPSRETDDSSPHGNIASAATTHDSYQRGRYESGNHEASRAAPEAIENARTNGNPDEAWEAARRASEARNARRLATQDTLTPPGRMISQAIEGERGFDRMRETYSRRLPGVEGGAAAETQDLYELSRRIAVASGESKPLMRNLGRAGRVLGPVGVGVSFYSLGNDFVTEDYSMAAGDFLTVVGSGLEVYAVAAPGATVAGASAMTLG